MKFTHGATATLAATAGPAALALLNPATAAAAPAIDIPNIPATDNVVNNIADRVLPPPPKAPKPIVPEGLTLPNNLLRKEKDSTAPAPAKPVPTAPKKPVTINDLNKAAVKTRAAQAIDSMIPAAGAATIPGLNVNGMAAPDAPLGIDTTGIKQAVNRLIDGVYTPFNEGTTPRTREEGIAGLADLFDAAVTDPTGTIQKAIAAAGSPAAWVTNPVQALTATVASVIGPEYAADLATVITQLGVPFLLQDLPLAFLAGLATLLLTPILSAIPGAILGASIGGLGASALALAALATIIFGTWIGFLGLVFLASIPIAIVIGVIIFFVTVAAGLGINPLAYALGIGAGFSTAIFIPILVTGAAAVLTIIIPVVIFGLLAPLVMLGALALGGIPGAIIGGLIGYGAGMVAAGPLAALVTALVGSHLWQKRWENTPEARDAWARLVDMWNRAWHDSNLGSIFDEINRAWWESPLGRAIKPLADAWAALWSSFDPTPIYIGALLGALSGILSGILTGFPQGALATALATLPMLLGALAATLIPPLALAIAATFAAGIGLWLIPFLAVAPIWALGILAVGVLLFAGALGIIAAGALIAVAIIFAIPTGGLSLLLLALVPVALGFVGLTWGIAGFLAGVGGVLATVFFILLLASLALAAVVVGIPTFLITAPFFVFPAVALLGPLWLLGVLAGGALAATVGAIFGAGTGGILGALAGLPFAFNWGAAFDALGRGYGFRTPAPAAPRPAAPPVHSGGPRRDGRVAVPLPLSPTFGTNGVLPEVDRSLVSID